MWARDMGVVVVEGSKIFSLLLLIPKMQADMNPAQKKIIRNLIENHKGGLTYGKLRITLTL